MSEQNKNPMYQEKNERLAPDPEQIKAFRTTYALLMEKATERGRSVFIKPNEKSDISEVVEYFGRNTTPEAEGEPNAVGGNMLVFAQSPEHDEPKEEYAWAYTYDERLVKEISKLGSFTVFTDNYGQESDIYDFYTDSNIEKSHWIESGVDMIVDEVKHISWLVPSEMEELGHMIQDGHFEFTLPRK